MIPEFQAFLTLFRQGKELKNAAVWKNRTMATNALIAFLGAALVVAKGFGYDISIDQQTLTALAGGISAAVCLFNTVMHVITSAKVGLPPDSGPGPAADTAAQRGQGGG